MKNAIDIEKIDESYGENDLIEAIQGRHPELPCLNALKQFVKRASVRGREVYQSIVEDSSQPYEMRKMAALELGKEYTLKNQESLVRSLKIKDDRVLSRVSHSLGHIGDKKALKKLEALDIRQDSHAYEDILFAKHLIAYRLRLNKHLFVPPPVEDLLTIDKSKATKFTTKIADIKQLKKIYKQVKHQLPAVPLSDKGALQITCRSTKFLLIFNQKFQSKSEFATLRSSNALPMVCLKKGYCPERYFLINYFFTHPSDKSGELILIGTRPSGTLSYSGTVKVLDNEFTFAIKAVKSRYTAALDIEGSYNIKTRKYTFKKALGQIAIDRKLSPAGVPKKAGN